MKKLGKFEVFGQIGRGAMGTVYKARDPLIGRLVALKTITTRLADDPELLARFYQEARLAGTLEHPNIVTIFELGMEDETPFIAMALLEGGSLDKAIEARLAMPLSQKLGYIVYVCRAIEYAHKQGVIHRDIKPANVMAAADGAVKVVDFGIARFGDAGGTQTGTLVGTLGYMSPQLIAGKTADARSDIWAVGVMFYELLAYRRPFNADNQAALMMSIHSDPTPSILDAVPGLPQEVADVIDRMLRKDANERFQSMDEVLVELEPIWKKYLREDVLELLGIGKNLLDARDLFGAQDAAHKAAILDTANTDAKNLLERINSEIRRLGIAPKESECVPKKQGFEGFGRLQPAETSQGDVPSFPTVTPWEGKAPPRRARIARGLFAVSGLLAVVVGAYAILRTRYVTPQMTPQPAIPSPSLPPRVLPVPVLPPEPPAPIAPSAGRGDLEQQQRRLFDDARALARSTKDYTGALALLAKAHDLNGPLQREIESYQRQFEKAAGQFPSPNSNAPAVPATSSATSPPKSTAEIQSDLSDAQALVQRGGFKDAWSKAAAIEQLGGDAASVRDAVRTAEEARYRQLVAGYSNTNKQSKTDLEDLLAAFQLFAGNAVNREADARNYANQITSDLAALTVVHPTPSSQPSGSETTASDPSDILALLNRYAQAVASGDLNTVKTLRQLSPSEEKKMADSLRATKGKGYALRNCSTPEIAGDTAKVTCETVLTGSKDALPGRITFSLRRTNGHWLIAP